MNSDFGSPIAPPEGPTDNAAIPYPSAVAEDAPPSRRERRRAKRRERRLARGRRLITFRTLLFILLLGAVIVGAFAAIRWYDTNSYFVGVKDNELIIYQGRIGGFLWYNPQVANKTGVTTADVPATYLQALRAGVEESSVASAQTYVKNLVSTKSCQTNPTSPSCTTPPTTVVPSTTTTKGT